MTIKEIEESDIFTPRWNADGLMPCITVDANNGRVLMMAWMNEESLRKTIETGEVHYFSRSRQSLWHKGAGSGAVQKVQSIKIDCDQDCLLIEAEVTGAPDQTCHTSRESCFYREIVSDSDHAAGSIKLKKL